MFPSLARPLGSLGNDGGNATTTTPENNDLIGWLRKNNHAARAARTLVQFLDVVYQMTTCNLRC